MSDLIDRQAVIDLLKQMRKDGDMVPWEGKDVFARIRKLPTIQPEKTQLSQEGTTSDLISRRAAIDAVNNAFDRETILAVFVRSIAVRAIRDMPSAQPELTDEQAITHLQSSGWMQRHDKEMYESGLGEQLADDSDSYDSLLPSAQPEPQEGHWIRRDCGLDVECKCSKCGYRDFVEPRDEYWFKRNYCPNCGADMRGGQNG